MTVRVTAIPAGKAGARYPWECRQHEHDRQAAYYHEGHEAPIARWLGDGVEQLGYEQGEAVVKEEHLILFGELCDPRRYAELTEQAKTEIRAQGLTGDAAKEHYAGLLAGARLGRAPREYRPLEERLAEALQREPDADAGRQAEIRREVERSQRSAVGSFDVTLSPQKSISLYRAGLLAQGRVADADRVLAAHRAGVAAALAYAQREAGFSRLGYHGRSVGDHPTTGRYADAHDWIAADFVHETSRAGDVQLHAHLQILNRVRVTLPGGETAWRTLDSRALHKARPAMEAIYHRTMEERLSADLPVEFTTREDGRAREIIGITVEDRTAASSRRQEVTAEVARYVDAYQERTGHAPSPQLLSRMTERAALQTRGHKDTTETLDQLVDRWEREAVEEGRRTHAEMAEAAEAAAVASRLDRMTAAAPELDRGQVIRTALEEVTAERTSFGRDDVMRSIGRALPEQLGDAAADAGGVAALLDSLTEEALGPEHGVIQVAGFEAVAAPAELCRQSDGRSVYQPGRASLRYGSVAHMQAEERMVAQAQAPAPRLEAERIDAAIEASTLGEDQAAAVRGVLGDGRTVSVIVGPAGAGKSYAQGIVTQAWQADGRRVIGLAPSNIAASVLGEAGVETTASLARFLTYHDGQGSPQARARLAVGAGDLIIVDEAAMATADDMGRLIEIATAAGAKVALVGDDAQMQAVGRGGSFRLLRGQLGAYQLETVRRFRDPDGSTRQWEADASLRLRDGDPEALAAYAEHGRIHGGSEEEMSAAAVRAYVVDTLAGRSAVLVTSTNEAADELAGRIRAELVRHGRVDEAGVPVMGGNLAGAGDLIQARENDPRLTGADGQAVTNRQVYRVVQRHADGSLTVRRVIGQGDQGERLAGPVRLPAGYVAGRVALAYAGTVHATQGRTVDSGYLYGDEALAREAAYVALTRGRLLNEAFLVTRRERDPEHLRTLDSTPTAVMGRILAHETGDRATLEILAEGTDYAASLPALVPIWEDLVSAHTRTQARATLSRILGDQALDRLDAEEADPLYATVREQQLRGHDPEALLSEAIGDPRSVTDARELGALLQHRVRSAAARRAPEHSPAGPEWADRTPDMPGPIGDHARRVAEAIDARQAELGRRAALQRPAWATERFGPVPEDEARRAQWRTRAGRVAGYQEMYDPDAGSRTVIGPAPARRAVEQHAAWNTAYDALGRPEDHRRIAAASDVQLRDMVNRLNREQAWAPTYAGDELAESWRLAREYDRQAILAAAEAMTDPDQWAEAAACVDGLRQLAAGYRAEAEVWEEIHAAHQAWRADTEEIRETAQAAAAELARRTADRNEMRERTVQTPDEELWAGWDQGQEPERGREQEPAPERDEELWAGWDVEPEREQP
ncbi:MAG: relaxase domain-containing protein, partial [Acidimicrobiales bacterium]|nr:relaxase domain-containing protein [Acidimicrobiales bacterium]